MKTVVRSLLANGQFEFINGGWCMNDEAATGYTDIIDQVNMLMIRISLIRLIC